MAQTKTKKQKDLAKLSIEELEDLNRNLDEQIVALRDQKRDVADAMSEAVLREQALHRLSTMSSEERRILVQIVETEGIPTEEAVGTPGNSEEE